MAAIFSKATENFVVSEVVFPGFKFSPTDVELVSYYLRRKIDGLETSVKVIPEVDIYDFEPWDLPDKSIVKSDCEWFFFCARRKKYPHGAQNKRATQMGYWKATGKERNVKSGSEVIGTKRTLVFYVGRAPTGERSEWIMHEYCMKGVPRDVLVVCRLRRNTKFQASSSQKTPELSLPAGELVMVQSGRSSEDICKWENMVDCYLSTDTGKELIDDIAESVQNLQAPVDEDFYADILRDEIVKLDEAVIQGTSNNESPTQQTIAKTSRVLPFPCMPDSNKQMKLAREEEPCLDKEGNQNDEAKARCLFGVYPIKTAMRNRWCSAVCAVVLVVLMMLYFG